HVRAQAGQLLAGPRAAGRIDLAADYAFELPLRLLALYFGLHAHEADRLVALMRLVWGGDAQAPGQLYDYALAVARRRRARPAGDVVSALAAHPNDLDDAEIADQV